MNAILEVFLNTFWQAAAVALVAWAGMRWMPRGNAATRGAVWWSVLAFVLLLPAIRVMRVQRRPGNRPSPVAMQAQPAAIGSTTDGEWAPTRSNPPYPAPQPVRPSPPVRVHAGSWPGFFLALWCAVCLAQLTRLALSFRHLRHLKRNARPAAAQQRAHLDAWLPTYGVRRPVRLLVSGGIPAPVAVGFLQPAVLLPEALLAELTPVELDHVLLHELAHLARRDDWANLGTRVAWAILALHPVAAFALRQIDRERELACDDWVVSATGAARPYAASLARLFEVCVNGRRMLLASGIAGGGSQLGNRIALLLRRGREFTPRASALRVCLCTGALLVFAIAASRAPAWMAFAQTTAAPAPAAAVDRDAPPARAAAPPSRPRRAPAAEATAAPKSVPLSAAPAASLPAAASDPAPTGHSLLAALVANGYGDLPVDEIVDLKNQGVSADFLAGMAHAGMGKLTTRSLIELRQHGVRPDYVRDIMALGFGPYTTRQIVDFKNQGVRVELFAALKEYGLLHADPGEIREASMHGVGPESLREARRYSSSLNLKQIIRLKQAGII